jgi:rhodanese-related sulfurtransferase
MRETRTSAREISVEEFDEMIENHDDLLIVDVREAGEFRRGHIPGALLLPHGLLEGAVDDARRMQIEQLFGGRHKTFVLCSRDGSRRPTGSGNWESKRSTALPAGSPAGRRTVARWSRIDSTPPAVTP